MRKEQETADSLKKKISARKAAVNQYDLVLEERKEQLSDIDRLISDLEKEKKGAVIAKEKALDDAFSQQKLAKQYEKETAGKEVEKERKHAELKVIRSQVNGAKYELAGLQERMDIDYAGLVNRVEVAKREMRKPLEKIRDLLR